MLKIKKLERDINHLQFEIDDLNSQVGLIKLEIARLEDMIISRTEPKKRGRKAKAEDDKKEEITVRGKKAKVARIGKK